MKTIIKILVPLLVLAGIGVIIFTTQKSIDEMHSKVIERHDFKAYVMQYASDSIQNQNIGEAWNNYLKLYDMIKTEASVIVTDSQSATSPLLAASDVDECFEEAFGAYFPVFRDFADNFFRGSNWSSSDRNRIKNEAKDLKGRSGSSIRSDSLTRYIQYVDGYDACKRFISNAKYCSNLNTYKNICNHYTDYLRYPYHNCTELNDIRNARQTAETSWKTSIEKEVNRIIGENYCDYTYRFNTDRENIEKRIDVFYNNTNGNYSWANNQKNSLSNKAREVAKCNGGWY